MPKTIIPKTKKPWQVYGLPQPKSEASSGPLSLVDYEIYTGLEVPALPFFVRLDGWAFHSLAKKLGWKRPFDQRFAKALVRVAETFFVPFNPALAYLFSDEINLLFTKRTSFSRVEKIDSVFAGIASATLTSILKQPASFDCRVIPIPKTKILPYLVWRQAECFRNHNNAWAQWVAINKDKLSAQSASKKLSGMKTRALGAYCREHGVDLALTPTWQRNGILLRWESYQKIGYDPIKKVKTKVLRRRVLSMPAPVFKSAKGKALLSKLLC